MMLNGGDCTGTGSQQALIWALASASQITWAAPLVIVVNTDKRLYPAQQGSGFLLAIFTKVCFFPSLHSRVYPEWFNYNFPCVRQIKEESRSVVPSTLFISLTDCSSPNPRAAAPSGCSQEPAERTGARVQEREGSKRHRNRQPRWVCETSHSFKKQKL